MSEPREGIGYEGVAGDYLADRNCKDRWRAPAVGLGVGDMISCDFFGWNFGLNAGDFGGMLIAVLLMATMHVAMITFREEPLVHAENDLFGFTTTQG